MALINPLLGSNLVSTSSFDSSVIGNSVWLDGSADYLSKTPGSTGNQKRFTFAFWVQRTAIAEAAPGLYSAGDGSQNNDFNIYWNNTGGGSQSVDTLCVSEITSGSVVWRIYTSNLFRDTGWYHIIVSVDTDESTAADRVKIYINGNQVTSFASASYPSEDADVDYVSDSANEQRIGRNQGSNYLNGYIAQYTFLDGDSIQNGDVAVTDFLDLFTYGTNGSQFAAKADADIAALASSAGGNSYCLDFGDSSALGNDISSEENDWTANSMAAANQSSNTPSNVHATMDILKRNYLDNSTLTISEGNLRVTGAGGSDGGWISTLPLSTTGTTEFQSTWNDGDGIVGITCYDNLAATAGSNPSYPASPSNNVSAGSGGNYDAAYAYRENGQSIAILSGSFTASSQGDAMTTNSVLTVRYNADDNEITYLKDNVVQGSAVSTVAGLTYYAFCCRYNDYDITFHFEEGKFPHTIGSGNKTMSSSNLVAPTHQGIDFFNGVKYTGNGTAIGSGGKAVTGANFQPDFVWIKNRDATDDHALYDAVRGTTKQIESDNTAVQTTESEGLTAFGSDGFTVGSLDQVNTNTEDFIAWLWKAQNGTTAISADGPPSLASTVSKAEADHFSIVSYTGDTTSAQTIGHGLGGPPEMIIIKNLAQAGANWAIYHKTNAATNYILFSGGHTYANANYFNDTEPTTSAPFVFSVKTLTPDTNGNGQAMIAYCFRSVPGVCRVGGYLGTGNANGQYIQTGFKPKFVMAKWATGGSLSGENWITKDTTRQPLNENQTDLAPSSDGAEATGSTHGIDILADGFKMRGTGGANNVLNATYIYLAMAEIGGNGTLPPIYGR